MRFELWDTETNNIIGVFSTEIEALAVVLAAIEAAGAESVEAWTLGSMGGEDTEATLDGSRLADRALTTLSRSTSSG